MLVAAQAAPVFAPPLDQPIIVTTETLRSDGPTTRRFVARRALRFSAAPDGYRVEVRLEATAAGEEDSDPAGLLQRGFARLAGRTVVLRLDSSGTVTAVEDADAVWRAVVDGIAALAPKGADPTTRASAARVAAIAKAIDAQPETARRTALASLVAPLIAPDLTIEAATPAPPRAVRVPASSIYGKAELDGLRSIRRRDDAIEISVSATGQIAITAPEGKASATITLETLRRIDPASGLVMESREHVETLAPDGSLQSERLTVTRLETTRHRAQ